MRVIFIALLALSFRPATGLTQRAVAADPPADRDPIPEHAISAIVGAFDSFAIVGLGDIHGTKDINDFVLSLVRDPAVVRVVNDLVLEGLPSNLQPTIDRYLAGDDLPVADRAQLWSSAGERNEFHVRLFQLVRRVNQDLPSEARIRILAAEPPPGDGSWRDTHIAGVVDREVIAKRRKALLFYGGGHLQRGVPDQVATILETAHPGTMFLIQTYVGGRVRNQCGLPVIVDGRSHEDRMAAWPVPAIVRTKGTWLADFLRAQALTPVVVELSRRMGIGVSPLDPSDAYLYLGPPDLLLSSELGGRPVVGGRMATTDPDNPFACEPKTFVPRPSP